MRRIHLTLVGEKNSRDGGGEGSPAECGDDRGVFRFVVLVRGEGVGGLLE